MKVEEAITYIADDERVLSKLLIGAIISYVPILNFAWVGYITQVMQNVSAKLHRPLPEWDDLGGKFLKGLIIFLAGLIYSLPALLFGLLPLSFILIPAVSTGEEIQEVLATTTAGVVIVLVCCLGLYFLALSFFFPAVHVNFARQGNFRSCFQLKSILTLVSANLIDYLIAWFVSLFFGLLIGISAGLVGVVVGLIPCVGWILGWVVTALVSVWSTTVYAHLFGQVGAAQPVS